MNVFMINYSPYRCSDVARCLPGLLLLSVVFEVFTHVHDGVPECAKIARITLNGTPDIAGESNRNVQAATCYARIPFAFRTTAFLKLEHDSPK